MSRKLPHHHRREYCKKCGLVLQVIHAPQYGVTVRRCDRCQSFWTVSGHQERRRVA